MLVGPFGIFAVVLTDPLAYCSTERSEEKMPALAMFVRDIFAKRVRS